MKKKKYPKITLICTTGRRLEFFKETMKTFKENCLDLDLIDKFLICDDRSSDEEREKMKRFCMDIGMPELNGIEAIRKIKTANPDTIVLVLTVYEDIEHILGILESGADGYLTKNIMIEDIVQSVRLAVAGEAVLSHDVFQKVVKYAIRNNVKPLDSNLTIKLTTRELEILNLLSKGLSNKEIADTLKLKIRTVKSHLVVIFSKLNVVSRTEAVTFGLRSGLIKIGNMDELA